MAKENVKTKIPALLNVLKDKYDLDELSEANWEDYKNIMGDYESNIDYQSIEYQELSILSAFFDIYENESKNEHIIQLASAGNARMINDEQLEELILSLPSRSPASKKYQSTMKQSVKSSGMDRNAAVSYAEEYAQWQMISVAILELTLRQKILKLLQTKLYKPIFLPMI